MAYYFVRIELHGAKPDDEAYNVLHEAMEEAKFIRVFDKHEKKLPDGCYVGKGNHATVTEAKDEIKTVVSKTGKKSSIVVVRFEKNDDIVFDNLETISE